MTSSRLARAFTCTTLLFTLSSCDKIKAAMGKGGDGGTTSSTTTTSSGLAILDGFEGEIDVTAKGKSIGKTADKPVNFSLDVKGSKVRLDLPQDMEGAEKMGKAYGILDSDAKKLYFVMDAEKQVIVIDLNKAGDTLKSFKPPTSHATPGAAEPPAHPPKITKTGKTDTVATYTCENWLIESTDPADKSKAEVCVAEQGTSWFHLPMTGAPAEYAALGELVDGKHFPLRAIGYEKDGTTENGRLEVTKIDKKTLDPNLFVPPPTYKQIDLSQMFSGMGGMGGMPGGMPTAPGGHPLPHGGVHAPGH
jgi:hypothetical protein